MLRGSLLLSCLAFGCVASPAKPAKNPVRNEEPPGLYGSLAPKAGATLSIHRIAVGEPLATVALDGSPLALPLSEGTYVAAIRSESDEAVRRRMFAVGTEPITVMGTFDGPWQGEGATVRILQEAQSRWFKRRIAWKASLDSEPDGSDARLVALLSEALAETTEIKDERARTLAVLAAESMFGERNRAPMSPLLLALPDPADPALGAVNQFAGPVYLATKFGDAAAQDRGQAWLDAAAHDNPEAGARAVALYFALETARLHAPGEIDERYSRIPSLDIEGTSILPMIQAMFDPARLAQPGATLPAFSLPRLDDATAEFSNEDIAGQLVLLHFWATWCRPCMEKIAALERVHQSVNAEEQRVHFVSINCDEDPEVARRYRDEHAPMRWTHLHVGTEDSAAVLRRFGLLGPGRLLVGSTGEILATSQSLDSDLETTLIEALRASDDER